MKRLLFAMVIIVALASTSAFAGVVWTEDFESYTAGGNASSGGWIADSGTVSTYVNTPGVISTDFAKSGVNGWKPGWNTTPKEASRIRKAVSLTAGATKNSVSAWVYCGAPQAVYRNFIGFQSATSTSVGSDDSLVRMGAYSGYGLVIHYWTSALQTFALPTTTFAFAGNRWYNLDLTMQQNGTLWDIIYTVKNADGSVATTGTAATYAWDAANANYVVLGNTTGSSAPMYFDDVVVSSVPEPGSLLALATGMIGLVGMILRKRA